MDMPPPRGSIRAMTAVAQPYARPAVPPAPGGLGDSLIRVQDLRTYFGNPNKPETLV